MNTINKTYNGKHIEAAIDDDAVTAIRDDVISEWKRELKARELLPVVTVDKWMREYKYAKDKDNDMPDAPIIAPGGDIPRASPTGQEWIYHTIYKIALGYSITLEDYYNKDWTDHTKREVARSVAVRENKLIVNGSSDHNILGFTDIPGGSVAADNGTWDDHSATGASPYSDIKKALHKLQDQSNERFGNDDSRIAVLLNPENYRELDEIFLREQEKNDDEMIMRLESKFDFDIKKMSDVAEGTMYMGEVGRNIAELILANDFTIEKAYYKNKNQKYEGNMFERLIPVFYQYGSVSGKTDAWVKLTGI